MKVSSIYNSNERKGPFQRRLIQSEDSCLQNYSRQYFQWMEYKIYIHCLFKSKTNHIPTYVCMYMPTQSTYLYINVVKSISLELIYSILQPSKKLLSGIYNIYIHTQVHGILIIFCLYQGKWSLWVTKKKKKKETEKYT